MSKLYGGGMCVCGEENGWNEIRNCGRSHLAIFHSLTLCVAVRASAIRKSLSVSSSNSELNSEL